MPPKITPLTSSSEQSQPRATRAHKQTQKLHTKPSSAGSETAPNTSEDEEQLPTYAGEGLKRKLEQEDDCDMRSALAEMRILFANLSSKNEEKFNSLQCSIDAFNSGLADMRKSFEFLTSKHEALIADYAVVVKEKAEDRRYIIALEDQIEILQRKSRNSTIELRNIPQINNSETKHNLCELLANIGNATNFKVMENDIKDIYRVNTKKEVNRPIIVELASTMKKDTVLSSVKRFNKGKKKEDKLHSRHIKLEGPPKPIFVSECLTQRAKGLFYLARDFAKTHSYSYCWTTNGIIYLRQRDNSPHIRVNKEEDLKKLADKM